MFFYVVFMMVVDGVWVNWGVWGICFVLCGGGKRFCVCICIDLKFVNGGRECFGVLSDLEDCNLVVCLIFVVGVYV